MAAGVETRTKYGLLSRRILIRQIFLQQYSSSQKNSHWIHHPHYKVFYHSVSPMTLRCGRCWWLVPLWWARIRTWCTYLQILTHKDSLPLLSTRHFRMQLKIINPNKLHSEESMSTVSIVMRPRMKYLSQEFLEITSKYWLQHEKMFGIGGCS